MSEDPFKKVSNANSEFWRPQDPGEKLVGVLRERRDSVGKYNQPAYTVDVGTGEDSMRYTVSANKVLDDLLSRVKIGMIVRITFEGMKESKKTGNEYKSYVVEYAPPSKVSLEDSAVPASESASSEGVAEPKPKSDKPRSTIVPGVFKDSENRLINEDGAYIDWSKNVLDLNTQKPIYDTTEDSKKNEEEGDVPF